MPNTRSKEKKYDFAFELLMPGVISRVSVTGDFDAGHLDDFNTQVLIQVLVRGSELVIFDGLNICSCTAGGIEELLKLQSALAEMNTKFFIVAEKGGAFWCAINQCAQGKFDRVRYPSLAQAQAGF